MSLVFWNRTAVVEAVKDHSKQSGSATLYFYCETAQLDMLKASDLLASFVKQLLLYLARINKPCPPALQVQIEQFYGSEGPEPDFDDLTDIFSSLFLFVPGATYIFDGLDEFDHDDASEVLHVFRQLFQNATSPVNSKIFISSREEIDHNVDVAHAIPGSAHISISLSDTVSDIELYIETRVSEKMTYIRKLTEDPSLLEETKNKLLLGAEGMFLWVQLQLDALWDECYTDEEIRKALSNLPKGLDATYCRCLERIERHSSTKRFASKVLKWVGCASRPLHVDELREAIAFDLQDQVWNASKIPTSSSVMGSCANLIYLDASDRCVRFAHPSVKQFLLKDRHDTFATYRIQQEQGELECGESCVAYLSFSNFGLQVQKSSLVRISAEIPSPASSMASAPFGSVVAKATSWISRTPIDQMTTRKVEILRRNLSAPSQDATRYKFLDYAKQNWTVQTWLISAQSSVWDRFQTLAVEPNDSWNIHPWISGGQSRSSHLHGLLGWSVRMRHLPLLKIVLGLDSRHGLRNFCDLPLIGGGLPALHVAARLGYEDVVTLLLKVCAVNALDNERYTALHYAADKGHLGTTRALISTKGVRVNLQSISGMTPLWLAAAAGHEKVASILLENKAAIEMRNKGGMTPLIAAAWGGHREIGVPSTTTQVPVSAPETTLSNYMATLKPLSRDPVVNTLLKAGADYKSKDYDGCMALHWAAMSGRQDVVGTLLDNGADIEERILVAAGDIEITAIQLAVDRGHEDTVQLLLERKAKIDGKVGYEGYSVLEVAAFHNHAAITRFLLESGADGPSALIRAAAGVRWHMKNREFRWVHEAKRRFQFINATASMGREMVDRAIVVGLLKAGVDFWKCAILDEPGNKFDFRWNALVLAARNGHGGVVDDLLEAGADPNTVNAHQGTMLVALVQAARFGHVPIVRRLLEAGASVEAREQDGALPLTWAAENGHDDVVRLLLDAEAPVDKEDFHESTALIRAARKGHERVVKLLLDAGANIEAKDEYRQTALLGASRYGHDGVVSVLLHSKANIEKESLQKETSIVLAANFGFDRVVDQLLRAGALNKGRALLRAAKQGHDTVVKQLLSSPIDLRHYGGKALINAAQQGHSKVVDRLLNAQVDVDPLDYRPEGSALTLAARMGYQEIVEQLLEAKANVEYKDSADRTALTWAVTSKHETVVERLLRAGANPNVKIWLWDFPVFRRRIRTGTIDLYGTTFTLGTSIGDWFSEEKSPHAEAFRELAKAYVSQDVEEIGDWLKANSSKFSERERKGMPILIEAVAMGNIAIVRQLLDAGADINAQMQFSALNNPQIRGAERLTALMIAVNLRNEQIMGLVLARGADLTINTGIGMTALHFAVTVGEVRIVRSLLDHGADVAAINWKGQTPQQLAIAVGHQAVAKIIGGYKKGSR